MKKLMLVFALVIAGLSVNGQSSTVSDYGNYFILSYDAGPVVALEKDGLALDTTGTTVNIQTLTLWSDVGTPRRVATVDYVDFGFASLAAAYTYMQAVVFNGGIKHFKYDGSLIDTVFTISGSDTLNALIQTNDGTNITSSKYIDW